MHLQSGLRAPQLPDTKPETRLGAPPGPHRDRRPASSAHTLYNHPHLLHQHHPPHPQTPSRMDAVRAAAACASRPAHQTKPPHDQLSRLEQSRYLQLGLLLLLLLSAPLRVDFSAGSSTAVKSSQIRRSGPPPSLHPANSSKQPKERLLSPGHRHSPTAAARLSAGLTVR